MDNMLTLNSLITMYGLPFLNTLTKYPSILNYHELDKGTATNNLTNGRFFTDDYEITEKVDGANVRAIIFNGDYILGTRERFVYAKDDRIFTSELALQLKKDVDLLLNILDKDTFYVFYGEYYGYNITNGNRRYIIDTDNNNERKLLYFDVWSAKIGQLLNIIQNEELIDINNLTRWREKENSLYWDRNEFHTFFDIILNAEHKIPMQYTPVLVPMNPTKVIPTPGGIPIDNIEVKKWLEKNFSQSNVVLEDTENNKTHNMFGKSEGIIVRNKDRSLIRKIKFENYNKLKD